MTDEIKAGNDLLFPMIMGRRNIRGNQRNHEIHIQGAETI